MADEQASATQAPKPVAEQIEADEPKYIQEARQSFIDGKPKPGFGYRIGLNGQVIVRRLPKKG